MTEKKRSLDEILEDIRKLVFTIEHENEQHKRGKLKK
jgi:hypothetical protein